MSSTFENMWKVVWRRLSASYHLRAALVSCPHMETQWAGVFCSGAGNQWISVPRGEVGNQWISVPHLDPLHLHPQHLAATASEWHRHRVSLRANVRPQAQQHNADNAG